MRKRVKFKVFKELGTKKPKQLFKLWKITKQKKSVLFSENRLKTRSTFKIISWATKNCPLNYQIKSNFTFNHVHELIRINYILCKRQKWFLNKTKIQIVREKGVKKQNKNEKKTQFLSCTHIEIKTLNKGVQFKIALYKY